MGALLSLRAAQADPAQNVFVDFENARPTDAEIDLHRSATAALAGSAQILESLRNYTGCGEQIRKAIASPSKETEDEAWVAVTPCVVRLKEYYEFSQKLETAVPQLLQALCVGDVIKNLEEKQALAKLFAETLHFVLVFDDMKMTNPAIQNDFSYYRRTLNRMRMSDGSNLDKVVVKDELANKMSLFYANPTPMLRTLTTIATNFVSSNVSVPAENVTECFATMCTVCHNVVAKQRPDQEGSFRFSNPDTIIFCLRVMVGCIILFDHIHAVGAFAKNSQINIRSCIKLIQTHGGSNTEGLMNALRYTTKHLNDDSTPAKIKALLG